MRFFRGGSFSANIIRLVAVTNAGTLVLLLAAFVTVGYYEARNSLAGELSSVARTLAHNATAALSFGDHATGVEILNSLRSDPHILSATIFEAGGSRFAEYSPRLLSDPFDAPIPSHDGVYFLADRTLIVSTIEWDGQVLGRVVLLADAGQLRERAAAYLGVSALVLLLSLAFGWLISRSLVRVVVQPIQALAGAARRFSSDPASEPQLENPSKDEIGQLTICFRAMFAELRERDRQLTQHREHLEELVATRTKELEIARVRAEEAVRIKSAFLANMSHEIRTPLNGVIGLTALSLETELPIEAREYMELVGTSARSLLNLINDIMDFSKVEAGKVEIEHVTFDLHEQIGRTLKGMAVQCHGKGVELVFDFDASIPVLITGDPTRLLQVLSNLTSNAAKFTSRGEVVVSTSLLRMQSGSATVRFSVADTGIGIHPSEQGRIFESFTQADGSTTRKFGGTGLGLAISNGLVNLMGGEIRVVSRHGEGSTFSFDLTFSVPAAQPAPPKLPAPASPILVLDAQSASRRAVASCLLALKCRYLECASLEAALRAGQAFSAVVLRAVTKESADFFGLGEENPLRKTPVILLTPVDTAGPSEEYSAAQLVHVSRPAHPSEIHAALESLLARQGSVKNPSHPRITANDVSLRVLAAEDNPTNQRLLLRLLEKLGHNVTLASDGNVAIRSAAEGSFDVILMDCQMPEVDGFTAARAIRESERLSGRHTPIIAITANAMSGDRERCLAAGMDDYLSKPIDIHDLAERLQAISRRSVPLSV